MPPDFGVRDHLGQCKFYAKPCKRPVCPGTQPLSAVTWLNLKLNRSLEGEGIRLKSQPVFLCPGTKELPGEGGYFLER